MKKALVLLATLTLVLCCLAGCGLIDKIKGVDPDPEPTVWYTVTFVDENGATLTAKSVAKNGAVSYAYDPTDTVEWDYTFEGWATANGGTPISGSLPAATADVTYYAVVSGVRKQYTVSYNSDGGSSVSSMSVEYGASAVAPANPTKEGFRFMGWKDAQGQTVTFPLTVTANVTLKAVWNEIVNFGDYLEALADSFDLDVWQYIPAKLRPGAFVIDPTTVPTDYSGGVAVSSIPSGGFGEQWNMIVDNLRQTETFFAVLDLVDSVVSSSVLAFNNYLDTNPDDAAHYTTKLGDYDVTIAVEGGKLSYVLSFDMDLLHPEILMEYDIATQNKTVRIQLSDANAMKYVLTPDSYTLALRYGGVRRTYFSVSRDTQGKVSGEIFEYTGLDDLFDLCSAAQFYVDGTYLSAVGQKANGGLGSTAYITELYRISDGMYLGAEVSEYYSTGKIQYNTLWFNLKDISGITSVKEAVVDDATKHFINGSSSAFVAKTVGGISLKTASRRFDIEMRNRYFYTVDGDTYTRVCVAVPMMFIQEEVFGDFADDMKSKNNVTVSVSTKAADLTRLEADYDTLIEVFAAAKDKMSVQAILDYIGTAYFAKEE